MYACTVVVDLCNGQGWDDLYLGPINKPGFLAEAKQSRDQAVKEAALAKSKLRDEALAEHIRAGGNVANFQEPVDVQQGVEQISAAVVVVVALEASWHEGQLPAAHAFAKTAVAGKKRPGVQRKMIDVPVQVAVDKPEGWKESKRRQSEGMEGQRVRARTRAFPKGATAIRVLRWGGVA